MARHIAVAGRALRRDMALADALVAAWRRPRHDPEGPTKLVNAAAEGNSHDGFTDALIIEVTVAAVCVCDVSPLGHHKTLTVFDRGGCSVYGAALPSGRLPPVRQTLPSSMAVRRHRENASVGRSVRRPHKVGWVGAMPATGQ
jgi:hypothetical protein